MGIDSEKLERFSNAVNEEVEAQVQQILAEAEASKNEMLEKANDASLYDAYDTIKEEVKKKNAKCVRIISKAELESKREILLYREKLSNQVMENVKAKLVDFTKSKEYKDYLIKIAKDELESNTEKNDFTIYLSKEDMRYAEDLKKMFGENISIEEKDNIKIGGLCIFYSNSNVLKDYTLDSAVLEQKELFNSSSSLRLN